MSKITNVIQPAAFELIRDRIWEILVDEIDNQVILSYDTEFDADIVLENINPEDKADVPVINISLATGNYSLKDYSGNAKGAYVYNIDCYANAKTNASKSGDLRSAIRLQKLLRLCRYILDNPIYKTLGFANPFIHRVFCGDINIANAGKDDGLNSMMGRLTLNVEVQESTQLINSELIVGYETQIKISDTQKGYFYKYGN